MIVHCNACNHTWDVPMKLPMPIERALKAMKGAVAGGCPKCGAHGLSVICGPARKIGRKDLEQR
jgi:hypothetical protein